MKKWFQFLFFLSSSLYFCTNAAIAGAMGVTEVPWSVVASLGFGEYKDMYSRDGQTAIGRLAFNKSLKQFNFFNLGIELGVQSGNRMRLNVPQETIEMLGGLPIDTTMKPLLDLLATVRTSPLANTPIFVELKGGIAYRKWQMDRNSVPSLSKIDGEVQAGLGLPISQAANLSLMYQGIFGGTPHFYFNEETLTTGSIKALPIEHSVLLSLAYRFN